MKKIAKYSLIAFIATTFATSCTPDELMDWQGGQNIYFTHLLAPGTHMRAQDFVELRFFFMGEDVRDVLVPLSVTTTGESVSYDREFAFQIHSFFQIDGVPTGTQLVEGTHFDIERAIIRADSIVDTLWIRFYRTDDLQTAGKMGGLSITLIPNHHFNTSLEFARDVPNQPRWLLTRWIGITDDMVRPQFWSYDFFGAYSAQKFQIIARANGMPPGFLDGEIWNDMQLINSPLVLHPWFLALGHSTQYWLDTWHSDPNNPPFTEINAEGETVLMSMGPNITGN